MENAFDDIRDYRDDEAQRYLQILKKDREFIAILDRLYPAGQKEQILEEMDTLQSIDAFQYRMQMPLLERLERDTSGGITDSGFEHIGDQQYIFLSNHRDIIMDSAFLCYVLVWKHQHRYVKIAIGDNLFVRPWIMHLVRLSRSFIIRRNISGRDLLIASKQVSAYIHHVMTEGRDSIWIAQKEGRTKMGNDFTQPSVLKMLGMTGEGTFSDKLRILNLVPLAISYEKEPCLVQKIAKELNINQKSSEENDMKDMADGVLHDKGRIHFGFGKPISTADLYQIERAYPSDGERYDGLKALVDKRIYLNYRLWGGNYVAYDLLHNIRTHKAYTAEEKRRYLSHVESTAKQFDLPKRELARQKIHELYARPVINYKKTEAE